MTSFQHLYSNRIAESYSSQRIINFTQFLWLNFKRVDHVLTARMIGKTVVDKRSMKKIILIGGCGRNNFPLCLADTSVLQNGPEIKITSLMGCNALE